jgi:hypothetical protein
MSEHTKAAEKQRDNADLQRREVLRMQIDASKVHDRLSDTVKTLGVKWEQRKTADQIAVNRAVESERVIAEQRRRILGLEEWRKRSETELEDVRESRDRIAVENKRMERMAALMQRDVEIALEQKEERLAQARADLGRVKTEKVEVDEKVTAAVKKCEQLVAVQKRSLVDIHEGREAVRRERMKIEEKDKQIRALHGEIERLGGVIARDREEIEALEKRISTLVPLASRKTEQKDIAERGDARYESLRLKYKALEDTNVMLKEDNDFLHGQTRILKSRLSTGNATRVLKLEREVESLRAELAKRRSAAFTFEPEEAGGVPDG